MANCQTRGGLHPCKSFGQLGEQALGLISARNAFSIIIPWLNFLDQFFFHCSYTTVAFSLLMSLVFPSHSKSKSMCYFLGRNAVSRCFFMGSI